MRPSGSARLARCAETGLLVVNSVIVAEVSVALESLEELETLLPTTLFRRDPIPWEAAFLAGRAFARYRRRGGERTGMLADFLVGAHAASAELGLVSRDASYGKYFRLTHLNPADA